MSWKQFSEAYRKSVDIFRDPVNSANKYADGFSDPAVRATICPSGTAGVAGTDYHVYQRDYYWNNAYMGGWDQGGNMSTIQQPATVGDVEEGRELFTDQGPWTSWTQDVDSETSWMGAANPVTGLQWNIGGGKYGDKAMNVAFMDGHAKRQSFSGMCTVYNTQTDKTTPNFWNFTNSDYGPNDGPSNFCNSMPIKFK